MQIKTTRDIISYLSEWLSSINQQTTSAGEDVEKGEPFCTVGQNADWCSHWGKHRELLQKIKNGSAFWPNDSTSGNIFEGTQNTNLKEHKHTCVHCSVIHNRQDMEAAKVPISRWVGKTTIGHLHNGILLSCKKDNFTLCNSMDGPGEHYAKWNNPVRERQTPYDFTQMWNLMKKLN